MNSNTQTKGCHMSWTNITKTVELKDNAAGLIKSSYGEDSKSHSDANAQKATPAPAHKIILNQVSGQAEAGEIMALMGPSGSGKTSLLDVLSTRSTYQHGEVSLNGSSITSDQSEIKVLKRKVAYIKQQDIFFDTLTVKDQLTYTAFLRLGDNYTREQKNAEVTRIIELLRLQKCADTPIMLLSGGERKRVNIGTELLIDPSIIMLDEPTSGLDSTSAVALVSTLVSLAHDYGKTVIMSIHQPSSSIFAKFDKVLFLADGCVVYYGTPTESLQYSRKLGYPCPEGYNGSEHWMDLLVEDSAIAEDEMVQVSRQDIDVEADPFPVKLPEAGSSVSVTSGSADEENMNAGTGTTSSTIINGESNNASRHVTKRKGLHKFVSKMSSTTAKSTHLLDDTRKKREEYLYLGTPKARLITAWDIDAFAEKIDETRSTFLSSSSSHSLDTIPSQDVEGITERKFNTSWMTQFRVLLHRSMKNSRSKILTKVNIFKSVFLGLFTGLLWFQMPETEKHLSDRSAFLFFSCTYWTFDGMFSSLFTFPLERSIIFKERGSGSYHMSAYFLSKTLSSGPSQLVLPIMFWTIAYWMAGVKNDVGTFLGAVGGSLLSNFAGDSYGLLIGATVMDFQQSLAVMTVISLSLMAAGGLYIKNIPSFLVWVKYITPFKPGFEISQNLVFSEGVKCDGTGVLAEYCTEGVKHVTSEQVLKHLNSEGTVGLHIGIGFAMVLIPRYFAFLALKSHKGGERD